MTKMRRLRREARECAEWRGHKMDRFTQAPGVTRAVSICRDCKMLVMVDTRPPANGIDICGSAVALNCEGFREVAA